MHKKMVFIVILALCSFALESKYDIYVKNTSSHAIACEPSYCSAACHPNGGKSPCYAQRFIKMAIDAETTAKFTAREKSQLGSMCIEDEGKTYLIDSSLKGWKKRMSTQTWTYSGEGTVKIKAGKP